MGARAVGPWVGEQKPLGKTPLGGNSSPAMTYIPTFCAGALSSRFFLPSSPFIPFCFSAACLIACMYSVALHTLLCLQRLVCVSMAMPFGPYAGVREWACSLGYTSLVTFVGVVILVLLLACVVWRGM